GEQFGKLPSAECNGLRAQSRDFRDTADTATANAVGFDGRIQPTLLSAQGGQEHPHLPVVIPVRVVDPLQAFRAAASIGTRDSELALLLRGPWVLVHVHGVGFGQGGARPSRPGVIGSSVTAWAGRSRGSGRISWGLPTDEGDHRADSLVTSGWPDRPRPLGERDGLDTSDR